MTIEKDKWYNPIEINWKQLFDDEKSILVYGERDRSSCSESKDYACGIIKSYDDQGITLESFFNIGVSFYYDKIEKVMVLH